MRCCTISFQLFGGIFVSVIVLSSCGHRIQYDLNKKDIVTAPYPKRYSVQVAELTDDRPLIDRQKNSREDAGFSDCGDYTYDSEFEGQVAQSLTKMIVKHLEYSKVFDKITLTNYLSEEIEPDVLPSLKREGVDFVLTGRIHNFYGYYDQKPVRQLAFSFLMGLGIGIPVTLATLEEETWVIDGPLGSIEHTEPKVNYTACAIATTLGSYIGYYLESLFKREIAWYNKLHIQLHDTSTQEVRFEKTYDISKNITDSMPGFDTSGRKHEVVVKALRESVNELVVDLMKLSLE